LTPEALAYALIGTVSMGAALLFYWWREIRE
jgi:hypothetical protein